MDNFSLLFFHIIFLKLGPDLDCTRPNFTRPFEVVFKSLRYLNRKVSN